MAATPSPACNPTTSWYDFTYPLSWSNNCEVAQVLSDIPFISVGILVFGVFILFLVLKRVSLSAVWLFFSALLAFIAAVLDLGQILADGMAMSTTFVASERSIRAREVLFAFSIGFRFLFYWSYVAEPPLKARYAASTQRVQRFNFLTLERIQEPHSGSWMRRGFPGKLLGVSLLVAIITITALQIIWRVVPRFHQYSSVYAADAALELLVSLLLLLKLLLNTVTLDSPDSMLVHTFRECLAPISGLLVNIAIGVGGLLYFAFTESTVGRLLQAFEVYIIVVFVVVTAFLRRRDILPSTASSQDKIRNDVVVTLPEPPRVSTFRITPPVIETPRMSMVLGSATRNKESNREVLRRSARRSLNHVSSWMSSKVSRNRPRYEDEEVKLWNAEEVKVDPPCTGSTDTQLRASVVSLTQEPKEWAELVRDTPVNHMTITSALDAQSAIAQSMKGSIHGDQIVHPHRADVPRPAVPLQTRTSTVPISSVSPSVSSGAEHAGSIAVPPEASPVHNLGGIRSLASAPDSRTSLDELLRQQSQLDQSIEALKLFSARTSAHSSSSNSVLNHKSVELTRSSSTGQRTVCSDISLSSFPVPPWLTNPVPSLPLPHSPSMMRIRGDRRVRLVAAQPTPVQDTHAPVPPKTSAFLVDIPSSPWSSSVPHSPLEEENESLSAEARKSSDDSGGTRYNVTSFIGGLATPDEPRQASREKPWGLTESESSVGAIQTSSGMKKLPPRMFPVPRRVEGLPASPAVAKLSSLARFSILSHGDVVDEPADVTQRRIDDQTSRSLTIALSPQTPVTDRTDMSIPPTRPQPVRETGSPITVSAGGADRVQMMFVRPRPPPLALQSYGTPRVQVLTDD